MKFDTLVNFRDLGDYETAEGRKIKSGRLLRSGEPVNLSDNDFNLLINKYNLKEIIDFRTTEEVTKTPDDKIGSANYHHFDVIVFESGEVDEDGIAPSLQNMMEKQAGKSAADQLIFVYKFIIDSPVAQKKYRDFFDILVANTEGAVLWHCFAGKDRTGLAAALILYLLGATKETIFQDYLLTNAGRKEANEAIIAGARAQGASEEKLTELKVMMGVHEDFLEAAAEHIKTKYGSLDAYIHDVLGITENDIMAFRENYLV